MSILILGSEGSMGKRYQAILKFLGKPYHCRDLELSTIADVYIEKEISGFIIATPTDTHASFIERCARFGKPILCEKPVTKNPIEIRRLFDLVKQNKVPFHMMFQYQRLVPAYSKGETSYNYYKHGSDGLVWDALQIIGLAKGEVNLSEDSPIWRCKINGHTLRIDEMDYAYLSFVEHWLKGSTSDLGKLLSIHEKTAEMAKCLSR